MFLPHDERDRDAIKELIARIVDEEGQTLLGWRDVPTDNRLVGDSAVRRSRSSSRCSSARRSPVDRSCVAAQFERKLYVIRKRIEHAVDALEDQRALAPLLLHRQPVGEHADLQGDAAGAAARADVPGSVGPAICESALALVHQRFSTNTFPSWPLAHPYRYIAHNGEINTLRGNINWMRAREGLLQSDLFGDDLEEAPAGHPRGRQRHGDLRQRARVAGHGRPLAAARHPDDDSGAVERPRVDGRRSARRSTSTTRR